MKYLFLIQLVFSIICLSCTEVIRTKNKNILKSLSPDEFISSDTVWNNKSISLIRYNRTSLDISKIKIFDEYDSTYLLNNDLVFEDYKRYILNEVHYYNNKKKIDSIEYHHYEYIFRIDAETGDLQEKILFIPDSTILAI